MRGTRAKPISREEFIEKTQASIEEMDRLDLLIDILDFIVTNLKHHNVSLKTLEAKLGTTVYALKNRSISNKGYYKRGSNDFIKNLISLIKTEHPYLLLLKKPEFAMLVEQLESFIPKEEIIPKKSKTVKKRKSETTESTYSKKIKSARKKPSFWSHQNPKTELIISLHALLDQGKFEEVTLLVPYLVSSQFENGITKVHELKENPISNTIIWFNEILKMKWIKTLKDLIGKEDFKRTQEMLDYLNQNALKTPVMSNLSNLNYMPPQTPKPIKLFDSDGEVEEKVPETLGLANS